MTEGSPMEEEWLVDVLLDMKITKSQLSIFDIYFR